MTVPKLVFSVLFQVAFFGGLLFGPAGTFDWWRAWVFLVVVAGASLASLAHAFRDNEGLLAERFKPPVQKGQPLADKLIVVPFLVLFVGLIPFIPLDVFRFHLLPKPGPSLSSLGLGLFVVGWWIVSLALKENAFAATVVRHQTERSHRVIDTGIYRIVRHPMYAGALLLMVGMPLWLESSATILLSIAPAGLLALRIVFEERFLRRELQGYDSYTQRVRWRLIPHVW